MIEKLKKLIDLKSIVTLILVIGVTIGFFLKMIESETYARFCEMVLLFYFAKTNPSEIVNKVKEEMNGSAV